MPTLSEWESTTSSMARQLGQPSTSSLVRVVVIADLLEKTEAEMFDGRQSQAVSFLWDVVDVIVKRLRLGRWHD